MSRTDLISIFRMELLSRRSDLKQEVLDAVRRFDVSIGWHYILDFIWLLEGVETLPPGSTILDAGAGHGLMQMLLAARGHKVLSIDYSPRIPFDSYRAKASIRVLSRSGFDEAYLERVRARGMDAGVSDEPLAVLAEKGVDIVYWRADISDLSPLPNECVDAVVSVSALEHNSKEKLLTCCSELERVLKPGGTMHVTVCGSDREEWFHEPSKGWCYPEKSLIEYFGLRNPESNFSEAEAAFAELKQGDGLKEHLSESYFVSGDNGMPWGKWNPEYLALGVRKNKN
ncbi:MAG: class I SAM-dependent methyltransferase [Proteobacteria bacterium]|nr:class I SAM-dependent methyltransferase [Pseudodesulfovibrio sp.]MBU4379832.1 class I SAM-dependent methyltransferase [Pseudomonadota bacterium]